MNMLQRIGLAAGLALALVGEGVGAASAEDIQRTVHAHPTLSESMHEASLAADKRSIHGINR